MLKADGYKPGNVVLMTQTAGADDTRFLPLAANVRKELKLLLDEVDEDDSMLIALAGHGVQFQGENESYFCPADARLADRSTLIPLSEIYKALENSRAGLKVLLVNACRNDPQGRYQSSPAFERTALNARTAHVADVEGRFRSEPNGAGRAEPAEPFSELGKKRQ